MQCACTHDQSVLNVYLVCPCFAKDSKLTPLGRRQCEALRASLADTDTDTDLGTGTGTGTGTASQSDDQPVTATAHTHASPNTNTNTNTIKREGKVPLELVVTSTLTRAIQTALIALGGVGLGGPGWGASARWVGT